mgnify:FL=1|tara:strand:- start:11867 stop:12106 length:240 start_codon:yes stop_codon:yes gene_type:complete
MHPLGQDTSAMTDTEIQVKVLELGKKLSASYRIGNPELTRQVQLLYNDYLEEQQTRDRKKMEELLKSNDNDFGDIINID